MKSQGGSFLVLVTCGALAACAGHGGFDNDGGGPPHDSGNPGDSGQDQYTPPNDSGVNFKDGGSDGNMGGVTTVYANTDDTLYSLDPSTNMITLIGTFAGMGGGTTPPDKTVTDLAVNSNGDVYVNTESVVYKATIPTSPGTVNLTKVAAISLKSNQRFFALAFAPAGALDPAEILIGGDGNGELYSIDTTSGATRDLGNFGADPGASTKILALSGDLVFYNDASNNPTGLATIRSCSSSGYPCATNDYLVSVDMTALATAYKTSTKAATLLKGVYGGSTTNLGTGTGYGDLFGLGAWEGNVYAFARKNTKNTTPLLLTINTTTGAGTVVSSAFTFTNGWSGAGVTTSALITVPPPK
jgi:hypothetical protein